MSKRLSKMGWIVLAALLCLALVALPACTTPPAEQEEEEEEQGIPYKNDGVFVQMTIGDIQSLDPAYGYDTSSGEQAQYIYEPLLYFDGEATVEFAPILATDWVWSDADLTWTFTIRDGVKFHEGGDLTPEDVEYSFERTMVQDRRGGPAYLILWPLLGVFSTGSVTDFSQIDDTVEVDGDSVVFHLSDAAWKTPWLQIICSAWGSIVDKEWCIAQGDWPGTAETWKDYNRPPLPGDTALFDKANGTGPWKLETWDPGVQVTLVRNDDYWRTPAPFERVITKAVDEWTTRKLALLNGDADRVDVPRSSIGELLDIEDLTKISELQEIQLDGAFMNFDINPDSTYIGSGALDGNGIPTDFFTDDDVRLGFAYAFDHESFIADAFLGEAEQRCGPIPAGLLGFNPDASLRSLDLTKAEEHLKAAWGGELWDKGMKFTITYNAGNVGRKIAAQMLAESLTNLNELFEVSVLALQWPVFLDAFVGQLTPLFVVGWAPDFPDPDNWASPYMYSEGDFAWCQSYGSPEIDALIEAARYETDEAERIQDYYELQDIYHDDVPTIILGQPYGRRFFTKYIHGFYFNIMIPGNAGPLYYMSKSES